MKIVLAGGSGQLGTLLARAFHARGDEVVVLSRRAAKRPWNLVVWDAKTLGDWVGEIDGCDVLINLAGRSVNCRYNAVNRQAMMESRVESTHVLGQAIAASAHPPRAWLQSSTATIYAHRFDAPNDDITGLPGGDEQRAPATWRFSIDVARAWERTCLEAPTPHTRKVLLRSAMVMSPDRGGVFDTLLGLVKRGLGGTAGNGRQYVSWIHDEDFIDAIDWLIEHADMEGAVNLSSPDPEPNKKFMAALREAARVRVGLPAPAWLLAIGAAALGTETELLLKSRRVIPTRLLQSGFSFAFPNWTDAARDLCERRAALD